MSNSSPEPRLMELTVFPDGTARWQGRHLRCAIGKGGLVPAAAKREGDGATPIGRWALREVLYRPDRVALPATALPMRALQPDDGWCDAPADLRYNLPVCHPYPASAERLWRDDHVYDVIVPLGYNDDPVVPGKGSAIFLHCAQPDYGATEGCVALAQADLLAVLTEIQGPGAMLAVRG